MTTNRLEHLPPPQCLAELLASATALTSWMSVCHVRGTTCRTSIGIDTPRLHSAPIWNSAAAAQPQQRFLLLPRPGCIDSRVGLAELMRADCAHRPAPLPVES